MGDKLFLIGVKDTVSNLAKEVAIVDSLTGNKNLVYLNFWDNFSIIQYDTETKEYFIKEDLRSSEYKSLETEKELFKYMDDNGIEFIDDLNPLGSIFRSYTMAYLEIVRWSADVAYTSELMEALTCG